MGGAGVVRTYPVHKMGNTQILELELAYKPKYQICINRTLHMDTSIPILYIWEIPDPVI